MQRQDYAVTSSVKDEGYSGTDELDSYYCLDDEEEDNEEEEEDEDEEEE